jgi:AbiV family abortive infection protein
VLLQLYETCLANARDLLEDAEALLERGSAPRAFALAFTAYEEIAKSQLVADFYHDVVTEAELEAGFRSHPMKLAYLVRVLRISALEDGRTEATIDYDIRKLSPLTALRNDALYVGYGTGYEPRLPTSAVTADQAREMIEMVEAELGQIGWAEEHGETIGSRGLFK